MKSEVLFALFFVTKEENPSLIDERVVNTELEDIKIVYDKYFKDVYKYVLSLTQNQDLAEELTQETFFKAVKSIDKFDGRCTLFVWLCQIAKNTYFTHYQKSKRYSPIEEHLKECEKCQEIAKKIGVEFHAPQKELDDATFFKNIQQEYKIRNIVFSILLICLVGIGSHLARNYQFIPVGASSFQISEISQLEDKTIGFYMKICDGKDVRFITAKHANEDLQYISEVHFGTEEDYVVLWKEGMQLPEASQRMELDYLY